VCEPAWRLPQHGFFRVDFERRPATCSRPPLTFWVCPFAFFPGTLPTNQCRRALWRRCLWHNESMSPRLSFADQPLMIPVEKATSFEPTPPFLPTIFKTIGGFGRSPFYLGCSPRSQLRNLSVLYGGAHVFSLPPDNQMCDSQTVLIESFSTSAVFCLNFVVQSFPSTFHAPLC